MLIFTEYRATQEVLTNRLAGLFGKESVETIHGSKKLDERKEVVQRFNEEDQPRFIVSTAAGGEGLNLQRRCHTIVNYDLPWNPNVLQQRIGRVYRYGQTKPVVVYNLRVDTDSDAYADNKVYEYLERKLGDVVDALAKATGEGEEDLLGDVLGQAAVVGLSLEELHEIAIKEGEERVWNTINEKAKHLEEIMKNPEMTGMFKGLPRFNLDDYNKVQSRVTSDHLEFFVKQYCENARLGYRDEGGNRFSFTPSQKLAELAAERQKRDPYAVAGSVSTEKVGNATVDKEVAQKGAPPAPLWRPRIRSDGSTRAILRFFGRRVARYAGGAPGMGASGAGDMAVVRASGSAHRGQAVARAPAGARVVRHPRGRR